MEEDWRQVHCNCTLEHQHCPVISFCRLSSAYPSLNTVLTYQFVVSLPFPPHYWLQVEGMQCESGSDTDLPTAAASSVRS